MRTNYILFCMLAVLLAATSCGNRQPEEADTANVRLVMVENADTTSVQEFPGRVKASEEVNLSFKVSGTLMNVYVDEGSAISAGQLIAEIDPRDYRLQLDATEAEYLNVRAEAERVIALYADSVSTADAYDKARYGLQQITAKYENAQNQLADTRIYAPFNGTVQKRLFDPPTVIAAGMPVVTLISGGRQEIEINIPASTYINRHNIESFYATFDIIPDRRIPLSLISIAPMANANQLYTVRLALPQDVSPRPSPGMNTMVSIAIADTEGAKMKIPSSALFTKDGASCVYVYDHATGTVKSCAVTVERLHLDGSAIIAQGLSAGDLVVAAGVHKLTDNQEVRPMTAESETNVGGLL